MTSPHVNGGADWNEPSNAEESSNDKEPSQVADSSIDTNRKNNDDAIYKSSTHNSSNSSITPQVEQKNVIVSHDGNVVENENKTTEENDGEKGIDDRTCTDKSEKIINGEKEEKFATAPKETEAANSDGISVNDNSEPPVLPVPVPAPESNDAEKEKEKEETSEVMNNVEKHEKESDEKVMTKNSSPSEKVENDSSPVNTCEGLLMETKQPKENGNSAFAVPECSSVSSIEDAVLPGLEVMPSKSSATNGLKASCPQQTASKNGTSANATATIQPKNSDELDTARAGKQVPIKRAPVNAAALMQPVISDELGTARVGKQVTTKKATVNAVARMQPKISDELGTARVGKQAITKKTPVGRRAAALPIHKPPIANELLNKYENKKFTPSKRKRNDAKSKNDQLMALARLFLEYGNVNLANPTDIAFSEADTAEMGLLPRMFLEFHKAEDTRSNACGILGDRRRKGFASRSVADLENAVSVKFKKSCRDTNKKSPCSPFTLEYNENSIAGISAWAAKDEHAHRREIEATGHKAKKHTKVSPTVPAMFRKCQICGNFGHYEIECERITEDGAIELAGKTKTHSILQELMINKRRNNQELPFCHLGLEKVGKEYTPAGDFQEEFYRKSILCEVCRSISDADHMLICDGCDKLFHLYCLSPPLQRVPQGDWFCEPCKNYNDDVSSDVEIELCEDFVIEQRKRPRKETPNEDGTSGLHWQTAAAVVQDDFRVNLPKSAKSSQKQRAQAFEEQMVFDGFTISASSTSNSSPVAERVAAYTANLPGNIASEALTTGCIVALFLSEKSGDDDDEEGSRPSVGVVLAVDAKLRQALVQEIDEWEDLMVEEQVVGNQTQSLAGCTIRAVACGATLWYPSDELHVVARSPSKALSQSYQEDVLPVRVAFSQPTALEAPTRIYLKINEKHS